MQDIAERYIATLNETDPDRRAEQLRELYTPDATYTDPTVAVRGPSEIGGIIGFTQQRFAGFTFALRGPVDANHNQARFQWQPGPAGQPDLFVGFDVIVTSEDRIRSVRGFIDAAPAA